MCQCVQWRLAIGGQFNGISRQTFHWHFFLTTLLHGDCEVCSALSLERVRLIDGRSIAAELVQPVMGEFCSNRNGTLVIGKRKRQDGPSSLVLHLSGGATTSESDDGSFTERSFASLTLEGPSSRPHQGKPIVINGKFVQDADKKTYRCTFEGCDKAYRKPSRLDEHERSHRGEVRF